MRTIASSESIDQRWAQCYAHEYAIDVVGWSGRTWLPPCEQKLRRERCAQSRAQNRSINAGHSVMHMNMRLMWSVGQDGLGSHRASKSLGASDAHNRELRIDRSTLGTVLCT